jgi:hypothetical protein
LLKAGSCGFFRSCLNNPEALCLCTNIYAKIADMSLKTTSQCMRLPSQAAPHAAAVSKEKYPVEAVLS